MARKITSIVILYLFFLGFQGSVYAQDLKVSNLRNDDLLYIFDDPGFPGYRVQDGKKVLQTHPIGAPESTAVVVRGGNLLGYLTPEGLLDWYRLNKGVTFDEVLIDIKNEIVHAKGGKRYTLNQMEPIYLSFPDLQAKLQKDAAGNCNLFLATRYLEPDSPRTFYKIGLVVHSIIGCNQVLVDLTNAEGELTAGIFIGTYIRESGWNTTYGGYPMLQEDYKESCISTCTNIVYSGVRRTQNKNQFLIHQPSSRKGSDQKCVPQSAPEIELFRRYLDYVAKDFGAELFESIMSVPCTTLAPLPNRLIQKVFALSP